jgi:hypothetical protein
MNNDITHSRALKWSIIIAIIIVLNLFFNYAITLVYPTPQYSDFCPANQVVASPANQKDCLAVGGQWTQTVSPQDPAAVKSLPAISQTTGYCDQYYTCNKAFTAASDAFGKNVFIILVVLGIISIVSSIFLKSSTVVSVGLSLGGVLSLIIASARYWGEAGNLLRVLILALALVALIWVGLRKFKNS